MIVQACVAWLKASEREKAAQLERREIEDWIAREVEIQDDWEGVKSLEVEGYEVRIEGRVQRKVNFKQAEEIARENGMVGYLDKLFTWKAKVSLPGWQATAEEITKVFEPAVTVKPGRPTFTIEEKKA